METANDDEVIKLIERRYKKANPSFVASTEFRLLLLSTKKKLENDPGNKYIFIKELTDELKAYDVKHTKKHKKRGAFLDSDTDNSSDAQASASSKDSSGSIRKLDSSTKHKRPQESDSDASSGPSRKKSKLSTESDSNSGTDSKRVKSSTDSDSNGALQGNKVEVRTHLPSDSSIIVRSDISDSVTNDLDKPKIDSHELAGGLSKDDAILIDTKSKSSEDVDSSKSLEKLETPNEGISESAVKVDKSTDKVENGSETGDTSTNKKDQGNELVVEVSKGKSTDHGQNNTEITGEVTVKPVKLTTTKGAYIIATGETAVEIVKEKGEDCVVFVDSVPEVHRGPHRRFYSKCSARFKMHDSIPS